jgi:DNA-binding transcriptional LysR family regulator
VLELSMTNRLVDLVEEGIDLAVRGSALPDSSLVARKISPSELGLFAAREYLERRGRLRVLADLERNDCLVYGGRRGKPVWRLRGPHGEHTIAVRGPIICDDVAFLGELVDAGIGVGLLPTEVMATAVKAGRVVRVLPRYGRSGAGIYVVWPSRKLLPARVIAVRDLLIEELTKFYA